MLFLGTILGLLVGVVGMYLYSTKKASKLTSTLHNIQLKLKSTRSQLYRRRNNYKKKSNAKSNDKKKQSSAKSKAARYIKKANF